jgi:hypothetical protein
MNRPIIFFVLIICLYSCNKQAEEDSNIGIDSLWINKEYLPNTASIDNVDFNKVEVTIKFNRKVDSTKFKKSGLFFTGEVDTLYTFHFNKEANLLSLRPINKLKSLTTYRLLFDVGSNLGGTITDGYNCIFSTMLDSTSKFPTISDDSLLTLVQEKTFRYFYNYAHPVCGLTRERLNSGNIVTIGGSGFGLMAIIVGIERKFITRNQGFEHLTKIVNFLNNPLTDKFHGAFPHWMDGSTGKIIPFGTKDNGGDLVETAFLMEGLLIVDAYFKNGSSPEKALCDTIQKLWKNVEWSWYRHDNQNKLYWHWSPNYNWDMNMPINGWNEALMVYILAASSPTFTIPKTVYTEGWANNGNYPMKNGKPFYNITLPLGSDYGGPMFFAHYSFLGLDPRNLSDIYANYWTQNVAHTLINYEYCKANPKKYNGYSSKCWGLTASDIQNSYSACSPTNDLGVIAPTAAIASMPYTPDKSMEALKFFYYTLGDKLWGPYGFYDSFNITSRWFADSYIAIDQGPIICMIENYRSGLLWNLFMSNTDIKKGLDKLGFNY